MRIDLPLCSFKNCRRNSDNNCMAQGGNREGCEYRLMENAISEVEKLYPYKVVGDTNTYGQYNEAWQDCVELIKSKAFIE